MEPTGHWISSSINGFIIIEWLSEQYLTKPGYVKCWNPHIHTHIHTPEYTVSFCVCHVLYCLVAPCLGSVNKVVINKHKFQWFWLWFEVWQDVCIFIWLYPIVLPTEWSHPKFLAGFWKASREAEQFNYCFASLDWPEALLFNELLNALLHLVEERGNPIWVIVHIIMSDW